MKPANLVDGLVDSEAVLEVAVDSSGVAEEEVGIRLAYLCYQMATFAFEEVLTPCNYHDKADGPPS